MRYELRNAVAGILPAQYSVNEFIASSTPFLTPSRSSKSPTTSFAAKGLNSSSPPVFSLMELHHSLNVASPTPAGHEVCTFQVVVCAAAVRMNGAPAMPVATAAPAVCSSLRRLFHAIAILLRDRSREHIAEARFGKAPGETACAARIQSAHDPPGRPCRTRTA